MSDVSQGPGWWQASDGKWYPPEQAPGAQPAAPQPGFGAPAFGAPAAAGAGGPGGQELAEWPIRVISSIIEYLPVAIIAGIFSSFSTTLGILFGVIEIGWWIYNGMLNGSTGQSIGKRIMGLKVINQDTGELIGSTNGILRSLYHIVDYAICCVGFLFPLWDAKKQTIADKIAKTVVVTGAPKHEVNADLFKS